MIDTVIMTIRGDSGRAWRLNVTPDARTGADHYTGHIGNIRIMENLDGVTFAGSIAKYQNGENETALTREGLAAGLQKLQKETGIQLQDAVLRRVDCGVCIITEKPAADYLRNMGTASRYSKRVTYGRAGFLESVLYHTKTGATAFCAYDKNKEMQASGETIPEAYRGQNVLRLEYRILKRQGIRQLLGGDADVSPWALTDAETWAALKHLFLNDYNSIEKTGRVVFTDGGQPITPAMLNSIIAEHYKQQNPEQYKALIQSLADCGRLSEKNLERIRAADRKDRANYSFSDTCEMVEELNEKIRVF
jgi:hypothetical protein